VLARTGRGWAVRTPDGDDVVGSLLEALTLADLVAAEHGAAPRPDRAARRAARGPVPAPEPVEDADPRDAELAALRRTVEQLEHALTTRVTTERAIGVLAERGHTTPRAAFESLRAEARSLGRTVHDLADQVLAQLETDAGAPPEHDCAGHEARAGEPALRAVEGSVPAARTAGPTRRVERVRSRRGAVAPLEGRS
jgi:hypothetical protein